MDLLRGLFDGLAAGTGLPSDAALGLADLFLILLLFGSATRLRAPAPVRVRRTTQRARRPERF